MAHERTTTWDMLSIVMWSVLFAVGLVPDLAFTVLRQLANVSPYKAMVNSSGFISIAIATYFAFFVARSCVGAGATAPTARGRAMTAWCMAMIAFVELPSRGTSPFEPSTFLQVLVQFREIDDWYVRNVVLFVGFSKLFCWWILFTGLLRYHAFGNRRVFLLLPPLLPSLRPPKPPDADQPSQPESPPVKPTESPAPE